MADDEDEVEGGGGEGEGEQESKLADGDTAEVEGSSSTYTLTRHGKVYMCSCPAWKNQGAPVDMRTCKHLRGYLGEDFETARLGAIPSRAASTKSGGGGAANKKATAPPVLLAHKWEVDHNPKGWWMSEKLDGIRAYWDGETFTSRLGNRFFAPDWFVADLPADTLDGELWVGRKMFQKTTSIVRSGAAGHEWKTVQFVVFDAPNAKGTFEHRQLHAQSVLARVEAPHARWHEHVECEGFDHLREELARVEALGGEGLMLRQPGSKYVPGRSQTLLKVKTFHDAEATVIGHAPGTGKHKGRLGALVCQLPGGITFNAGTGFSDLERENPPAIGAVITFRYQELSDDGVPRFPSYIGERLDVDTPAPIAKSSRAIQTVPLAKGSTASKSTTGARTSAPETRGVTKKVAPPPPDDDDDAAPRKMHPAPTLESAGSDLARGKKFMFTGKLADMQRSQAQSKVTSIGGINAGSISADLDFLVVGDDGSPLFGGGAKGDKILKAEKLIAQGSSLKIISETEFVKMCDRTVTAPKAAPKAAVPPKPVRIPEPPAEDDDDDDDDDKEPPRKMLRAPDLVSAGSELARGKKFMFTGKLAGMQRSQAQSKVTSIGGVNAGSVSADLDFLIVGDDGSPLFGAGAKGDKILKAERLMAQGSRIKIISETEFVKMCDRTVTAPRAPAVKNVMPPKPPRPVEEEDEEEAEDEDDAASAAPPAKADDDDPDSPFAKYGPRTQRIELVNDDENKFWNIEVRGNHTITVFGKLDSAGQTRLSDCGSPSAAAADAVKRVAVKRKEGYE